MKNKIEKYFQDVSRNFQLLEKQANNIEKAIKLIITSLENQKKIIFCGNGGSAADSQHLSAELMGRYKLDRKPLAAMALTVDTSAITAIGNDYSFEDVFSRQLDGIGNQGDVLYATSTSGKSKNVLKAIYKAKEKEIKVICLTGNKESEMTNLADVSIFTPSDQTNYIQEMHIAVGQLICGAVEDNFLVINKLIYFQVL